MKLDNYRLNWEVILTKDIDCLSKKYPDLDIKGSYSSVIELLNENKIRYRIIMPNMDRIIRTKSTANGK